MSTEEKISEEGGLEPGAVDDGMEELPAPGADEGISGAPDFGGADSTGTGEEQTIVLYPCIWRECIYT